MTTQSFLYTEADALKVSPANLCACMGALHGEPYCHCEMERRGLARSAAHDAEQARFDAFVKSGQLDDFFAQGGATKESTDA